MSFYYFIEMVIFYCLYIYPGGGGVLSLRKGTDCSPTTGERWLSRPANAKKGGLSLYYIVGKGGCQGQFN